MRVVVVGAGVIGASIAWHLARAGADVVVIDSGVPGASTASFGWINASFFADSHHHHLRVAGREAYGRMMAALPNAPVAFDGALWWEEQGEGLLRMERQLTALGYPVERLERGHVQALEPDLKEIANDVLRFPSEGVADAGALAAQLLAESGAQRMRGVSVHGIAADGDKVRGVETSAGFVSGDRVVIAAGTGAADILKTAHVRLPMLDRPGVLVTTKPIDARIASVLVTPYGELRQLPDGRLLASAVAGHQGDDASEVTQTSEAIAARVLAWVGRIVGHDVQWDQVTLAYRPMPEDGLPVIGAIGPAGVHVAVMHSGVTLAAITGEAMAAEVLGQGGFDRLLAPYRPQRFPSGFNEKGPRAMRRP